MPELTPTLLALDFDGVLCDGLKEYFQTAWKAYCEVWSPPTTQPPAGLAEVFYHLRPVVESGWEMPVVLHAYLQGHTEAELHANWPAIAQTLIKQANLAPSQLAQVVDGVRDRWIAADLESWLAEHRFYPGVIPQFQHWLAQETLQTVIISTKEGRFIQQLLERQGVTVAHLQIFGKESQRPKHQTLRELLTTAPATTVCWFLEDRLRTLQGIHTHDDLTQVRLFLADWGYNTAEHRAIAAQDPQIQLLSLAQFAQDFDTWP